MSPPEEAGAEAAEGVETSANHEAACLFSAFEHRRFQLDDEVTERRFRREGCAG